MSSVGVPNIINSLPIIVEVTPTGNPTTVTPVYSALKE